MPDVPTSSLTLRELCRRFLEHASRFYRRRSGDPTREHLNYAATLDRFLAFAGEACPPCKINRHQVRAWLDQLSAEQLSRTYINACLGRLRRFIRWCADLDYIPLTVDHELRLVRPLLPFRSPVTEPSPRPELSDEAIAAISRHLPRWARDVVQHLRLSAARPGELLELTNAEFILDDHPRLTPAQHKAAHRGRSRVIPLSVPALSIIHRYHRPFLPAERLFYCRRSIELSTNALDTAWSHARSKAGKAFEGFVVYDVRRSVARKVRSLHGLDAAQALLGHAHASTTEIYAPIDTTELASFKLAQRAQEGL